MIVSFKTRKNKFILIFCCCCCCLAPNSPTELPKRWLPFSHMKHLNDQPKLSSSSSALYSSTTDTNDSIKNSNTSNKPIQQVASFSSLSDAVKSAMKNGTIMPSSNQLKRPSVGTVSKKDLNHLSPQSM